MQKPCLTLPNEDTAAMWHLALEETSGTISAHAHHSVRQHVPEDNCLHLHGIG